MKILIVTGGNTSERKISLMSATNVEEVLKGLGHQVKLFDLRKGIPALRKMVKEFDVVFPILHGEEGEGGQLQHVLQKLHVPYIGGDPKGFKEGWYKIPFKKWLNKHKILTSDWQLVNNKQDVLEFGFPSVLKSSNGGSSREVVILKSKKDLKKANTLLNSGERFYIEKFLSGVEVTVAVLINRALPVLEIVPPTGGWFNYKNKYSGGTKEIPHAPSVGSKLQRRVQQIAVKIHKALKLGHISRTDFIISDGKPFVLEVNTIPGLTSESLFPKAAKAVGISFPELLERLTTSAVKKPLLS